MRDKRPITVRLNPSVVDMMDEIADEFSLSRSVIIRSRIRQGLDPDELDDELRDAVPEDMIDLAEREAREEELLSRQKLREKKHSYDDRILGHFRKRLEGDAAYTPEGMDDLAKGYKEDARIWFDDEETISEKEALVDEWLRWYRMGYFAREHADTVDTEVNTSDVDGWFAVGRDLHRLRKHMTEVVEHVRSVADRERVGLDADAVVESIARSYSVCEGAVRLLLEHMVADSDGSISETLRVGGDTLKDPTSALGGSNGHTSELDDVPDDAIIRSAGTPLGSNGGQK